MVDCTHRAKSASITNQTQHAKNDYSIPNFFSSKQFQPVSNVLFVVVLLLLLMMMLLYNIFLTLQTTTLQQITDKGLMVIGLIRVPNG